MLRNICAIEQVDTDKNTSMVYRQFLAFSLYILRAISYVIVYPDGGVEELDSNKLKAK